mmetsp:Transcript_41982/g.98515  ORF Transcript_41982/g.98515 Transcript_41982/m.98515 type:complete len:218 (+) Transcript_41982:1533-2186(+)
MSLKSALSKSEVMKAFFTSLCTMSRSSASFLRNGWSSGRSCTPATSRIGAKRSGQAVNTLSRASWVTLHKRQPNGPAFRVYDGGWACMPRTPSNPMASPLVTFLMAPSTLPKERRPHAFMNSSNSTLPFPSLSSSCMSRKSSASSNTSPKDSNSLCISITSKQPLLSESNRSKHCFAVCSHVAIACSSSLGLATADPRWQMCKASRPTPTSHAFCPL